MSNQKYFSNEIDTTVWFADKLVLGEDSINLDLDHHLYKFSDSVVTDWYFQNDTLKPWRENDITGGFINWSLINDSVLVAFRAYVPYFMDDPKKAGPSYFHIDNTHSYLDHLVVKRDSLDPIKLENAIVIIKRVNVYKRVLENLMYTFEENPKTQITL